MPTLNDTVYIFYCKILKMNLIVTWRIQYSTIKYKIYCLPVKKVIGL